MGEIIIRIKKFFFLRLRDNKILKIEKVWRIVRGGNGIKSCYFYK